MGDPGNGTTKNGNRRFSLRGRAQIEGALRAVEKTSGTVLVESLNYREGEFELSGKDLSARMDPAGVRWTGGTILAAGNPLRISGKRFLGRSTGRPRGWEAAGVGGPACRSLRVRPSRRYGDPRSPDHRDPGSPLDRGDRASGRRHPFVHRLQPALRGDPGGRGHQPRKDRFRTFRGEERGRLHRRMGRGPAQDGRGAAPLLLGGFPRHAISLPGRFSSGHPGARGVDRTRGRPPGDGGCRGAIRALHPGPVPRESARRFQPEALGCCCAEGKIRFPRPAGHQRSPRIARSGSRTTWRT